MASTIQIKRGTGSAVPSGLADGELAINLDSGKLYFGSGSTSVDNFTFGELTAEKYIVSSSVLYVTTSFSSGSTAFGDTADDTHTFTGDITASGNISSSGKIYADEYYSEGVLGLRYSHGATHIGDGNNIKLSGTITASGAISASGNLMANSIRSHNHIIGFWDGTSIGLGYENNTPIQIGKNANPTTFIGSITASGDISSSGTITANSFTGNGLSIDGPSNSHVEVGEYIVGVDFNTAFGDITGSGLIISGAMADTDHHNMLKIGNVELIDLNTAVSTNEFLIHNVSSFKITSGSDGGDVANETNNIFVHNGHEFFLCKGGETPTNATIKSEGATTTIKDTTINLESTEGVFFTSPNVTSSITHFSVYSANPTSTPQQGQSLAISNVYPLLEGAVTASAVSSSGNVYAVDYFDNGTNINTLYDLTPTGTYSSSLQTLTNITASGNISSSGKIYADEYYSEGVLGLRYIQGATHIGDGNNIKLSGTITASGNISSSGTISAEHFYSSDDIVAAGDISSSGNVYGMTLNTPRLNGTGGSVYIAGSIQVTSNITASNNISSSGNIIANEFHGDGSNLTGISGGGGDPSGAQTGITTIFNTGTKIGYADNGANIDFTTDNNIIFDIDGTQQIQLADGVLKPVTDSDVDLGTDALRFKDAYVDSVTSAGIVTAKTYDYISCGFFDNLSTTLHYLPLNGKPSEQTSEGNSYTDWVAPCHTTVLSIQVRFSSIISSGGDITMTVWKDPIGSGTKTSVEAETVSVGGSNDNDVIHFLFDGAVIDKGETMKISIQSTGGMTSANTFVTVVLLQDWNDRYTASSQVFTS